MPVTSTTTIVQAEGKSATGISVPADALAALGTTTKRPPVTVTLARYTYRSTVAAYGDVFMLPLSQEHRTAAGVAAGDEVEVTLELDTQPRTVELPDDLAAALASVPGARDAFDRLAPSTRKEHVRQVGDAKTEATRDRRVAAIVTKVTPT